MIKEPEHWREWGRYAVFKEDRDYNLRFVRFREGCPDYIRDEINEFLAAEKHLKRSTGGVLYEELY